MTLCPDPDTLAAIDTLDEHERAKIVDHAASCETCRMLVTNLLGVPTTSTAPPTLIDRYRIERTIGAGAMGVVYAAFDPELARPVAIKVLHRGGSRERMQREARALAKLAHPNVVGVYDVGEHGGSIFVAMALVDGETLRTWLTTAERTVPQIVDAIVQAARGVEAAHKHGIIHRDIKPDNIFVAHSGEVLVGDFGLATSHVEDSGGGAREAASTLTRDGVVVGTPAYMAPEQIAGDPGAGSDQFALCVTAWEALYGSRPFRGDTLAALSLAVKAGVPGEPPTRAVPAHVRDALRRGLAADPAERHPSVTALIAALTPPRRRSLAYAAVGFAASLAVAGGIAIAARSAEPPPELACTQVDPPVWSAPRARPSLRTALTRVLDSHAAAWARLASSSCSAARRRELSESLYRAISQCLDRRRSAIDEIVKSAEEPIVVLEALETIEPAESCHFATSTTTSPRLVELHREVDHALALVPRVFPEPATIDGLMARARELDDTTTLAELQYLRALADDHRGGDPTSLLREAIAIAERARDDRMRTRSSAMLALVAIRGSRLEEGRQYRDVAAAAVERVGDPVTKIAVERATIALAFARGDLRGEIDALRRVEALAIARFGAASKLLVDTRFQLVAALHRANDPDTAKTLELATQGMGELTEISPFDELEYEAFAQRAPAIRIPIEERALAIARGGNKPIVYLLRALSYDYELVGAWDRALAASRELLTLELPEPALAVEFLENAANAAFEIADQTDDKAVRVRMLDQALADLHRLPAEARELDSVQSLRGRILALAGRHAEALLDLNAALATAERSEPAHPYRIAIRSFALARVLWEVGGVRERDRARALADQAAKRFPEARAIYAADAKAYGGQVQRLDEQVARLEAWRRSHH